MIFKSYMKQQKKLSIRLGLICLLFFGFNCKNLEKNEIARIKNVYFYYQGDFEQLKTALKKVNINLNYDDSYYLNNKGVNAYFYFGEIDSISYEVYLFESHNKLCGLQFDFFSSDTTNPNLKNVLSVSLNSILSNSNIEKLLIQDKVELKSQTYATQKFKGVEFFLVQKGLGVVLR